MPVITRQQSKKQEPNTQTETLPQPTDHPKKNHANIDFEDASKEWRKNKIKHENCCFTYIRTQTHNHNHNHNHK
jgi:hypothetical protein